jgi:adenine-specific DNA-methyltransferase
MPVELNWDGKYDKDGRRVGPVRITLPFQTIETVNESGIVRARQLDLFTQGKTTDWRNRLIWGDKKYVLPSLLPEFAGRVNLIYIDPPFATGDNFSFTATVPEAGEEFVKEPGIIEQKAYRDIWGGERRLDNYLQWFYSTIVLLHELLSEEGSIYVHLDYHIGHYAKAVLDEVFGYENLKNEIIWQRFNYHADAKRFGIVHDNIFFYTKSQNHLWNPQVAPLKDSYIESHFTDTDENGRIYRLDNMLAKGDGPSRRFGEVVLAPNPGTHWRYGQERIDELWKEGKIVLSGTGRASVKRYLDEIEGAVVHSLWTDIKPLNSQAAERLDYPTQKPEALLERIIKASSNEGDLILDCFCGSGTTAAVAEKLGRRWITCDLGRFAIHTARKRLLSIPNVRPFVVQNLGKYERQAWQAAEFGQGDQRQAAAAQLQYRRFILDLYHAEPLENHIWLHGVRNGRFVHVGSVDSPVAVGDVQAIAHEVFRVGGQGMTNAVDILGWDFAFETNETIKQLMEANNIKTRFLKIPREVLEKKAVEQGDIRFYELAALSLKVSQRAKETIGEESAGGRYATVTLTDFVMPPDGIPEDVQQAVKHWSQWIDYWAVDWDFKDDTFHNMDQRYRTRKDPKIQLSLAHLYEEPGKYQVVVKVIDILGNDTTKALIIDVTK